VSILRIHDVSPYIHAGQWGYKDKINFKFETVYNRSTNSWSQETIQCGGVAHLMNKIKEYLSDVQVFMLDSEYLIRREKYPNYKSSRPHKESVELQKLLAAVMLEDCNINCFKEYGYEADDLIFSYRVLAKKKYDRVIIHTVDHDLAINIDKKTTIQICKSNGAEISTSNYNQFIKANGNLVPYNMIIPFKLVYGDSSDVISPATISSRAAYRFLNSVQENYIAPLRSRKECVADAIEYSVNAEDQQILVDKLDECYPYEIPLSTDIQYINLERFNEWGRHLGMYGFGMPSLSSRLMELVQEKVLEIA